MPSVMWRCPICGERFRETDPKRPIRPVVRPTDGAETVLVEAFQVDCGNGWEDPEEWGNAEEADG